MSKECLNCKHGEINFWGHDECWHSNKKIDFKTTTHTAFRELQAVKNNFEKNCKHFIAEKKEITK